MHERTNEDRAAAGERAVAANQGECQWQLDRESAIRDVLADLMHWAKAEGLDFDAALEMSRIHFNSEVTDEEDGE